MPQVINTNVSSLNAQRNLNKSQAGFQTALQRLSSGLRINSAKDDAAGLAISNRLTTKINGFNQAARNASDGISFAQVAEGGLQEATNILQRTRELALQSLNGSNTAEDRAALNNEVSQLLSEYDRITAQTEFNGVKVLTGFSATFQVGADVGQVISVGVDDARGTQVGATTTYGQVSGLTAQNIADRVSEASTNALDGAADTLNNTILPAVTTASKFNNSSVVIDAVNSISGTTGVTAFSFGNALEGTAATGATAVNAISAGSILVNGVDVGSFAGAATRANLVTAINNVTSQTGVTAALAASGTANALVLTNTTGESINLAVSGADAATFTGFASGTNAVSSGQNGAVVLSTELNGSIAFNDDATSEAITGVTAANNTTANYSVSASNILTVGAANQTVLAIDEALSQIDGTRSELGAIQNRFSSTIANLEVAVENSSAARSRILDADFAKETAALTKNQILQQAGTSVLAQANSSTQNVLSLLQ